MINMCSLSNILRWDGEAPSSLMLVSPEILPFACFIRLMTPGFQPIEMR